MIHNLASVRNTLSPRNAQEAYHDAVYYRDEMRELFLRGDISLRERALAESLFWHSAQIANMMRGRKYVPMSWKDSMRRSQTSITGISASSSPAGLVGH